MYTPKKKKQTISWKKGKLFSLHSETVILEPHDQWQVVFNMAENHCPVLL
jgi:hypothetical protein